MAARASAFRLLNRFENPQDIIIVVEPTVHELQAAGLDRGIDVTNAGKEIDDPRRVGRLDPADS